MPKTHVEKSIHIQASVSKVFGYLSDFHKWPAWSPWLVIEPDAQLEFETDGSAYAWQGDLIGSGRMIKLKETPHTSLEFELKIFKPYKAQSQVSFKLSESNGGTDVSWIMDGKLPLLMFWVKPMLECLVKMDYDRGLIMLKDLCENGVACNPPEKLGIEPFSGCQYVGVTTTCAVDDIKTVMQKDFDRLRPWVDANKDTISGVPFTQYQKWSFSKGTTTYTVGYPVKDVPAELPEGFVTGELASNQIYVIKHAGAYRHMGNAWSLGMMMGRAKKIKQKKGQYPFELYLNNPQETDEEDLVTHICFPVEGDA